MIGVNADRGCSRDELSNAGMSAIGAVSLQDLDNEGRPFRTENDFRMVNQTLARVRIPGSVELQVLYRLRELNAAGRTRPRRRRQLRRTRFLLCRHYGTADAMETWRRQPARRIAPGNMPLQVSSAARFAAISRNGRSEPRARRHGCGPAQLIDLRAGCRAC